MKFHVQGMTCGHCKAAVEREIGKVAPNAAVTVDLAAGTVDVNGDVPEHIVRQAIGAAGYESRA